MLISGKYYNIPEYLVYKISLKGNYVLNDFIDNISGKGVPKYFVENINENIFNVGFVINEDYRLKKSIKYLHTITPSEILSNPGIIDEILCIDEYLERFKNKKQEQPKKQKPRTPWDYKYKEEISGYGSEFDWFLNHEKRFVKGQEQENFEKIQRY